MDMGVRATAGADFSPVVGNFDSVPIVLACNGSYVEQTVVAMHSILANRGADDECYELHVLGLCLTRRQLQKLRSVADHHHRCRIFAKNVDPQATIAGCHCVGHYSAAANLRLLIPDLFPDKSRALWLDSDILAVSSLQPLLTMDLGECYLAAVREMDATGHARLGERLDLPTPANYFNAGVLLLHLDAMRRDAVHRHALQLLQRQDARQMLRFPDQDALNLAAFGRVHFLPPRWNCFANGALDSCPSDPAIIHFAGSKKPWNMLIASGKHREHYLLYHRFEKSCCKDRRHRIALFFRRLVFAAPQHFFGLRDLVRLARYALRRRFRRRTGRPHLQ
ncbi:MAG: glycosyltransferase family 8 protein [Puniceicoccales bacterium]|jgi:lipopolysaccharide biosynthesis glycosyltransferase|nr:glycosyltransferase family 8 protein [Puniceicoccales bacterium]